VIHYNVKKQQQQIASLLVAKQYLKYTSNVLISKNLDFNYV